MVRFNPDHPAYRYQSDYFLTWERQRAAAGHPAFAPAAQPLAAAGAALGGPEIALIAVSIVAAAALGYVAWSFLMRRGAARRA